MNILLTTAQDHLANGFAALRAAFVAAGANVLSVAPARNGLSLNGKPVLRVGGDNASPIYRHDGPPIACVRAVIEAGMAEHVNAVVCGIQDEGSVDAALAAIGEAVRYGLPALSVSRNPSKDDREQDYRWAAEIASEWAYWMAACPPPRASAVDIRAPQTLRHRLMERGGDSAEPCDAGRSSEDEARCVDTIVKSGHVAVAPISFGVNDVQTKARLDQWLNASLQMLNPRLGGAEGACVGGCCG